MDIVVSAAALVVLVPVLAVIAAMIWLDSRGPAIYRQERVGPNQRKRSGKSPAPGAERRREDRFGRPFTLFKFRTMYVDSRERFPELYAYSYSPDELRTIPIKVLVGKKGDPEQFRGEGREALGMSLLSADPRVTSVGRWLRRTSLDELPNLLNVLKGDMHLVGPRPDIADNVRYYTAEERKILDVKPGVTGLAQVRGRGFLTFQQTNALDLEYVRSRSLWLDIKILLATVPALLKREGAF